MGGQLKILVSIHICAGNLIVPFFPIWDPDLSNQINDNYKLSVGAKMVEIKVKILKINVESIDHTYLRWVDRKNTCFNPYIY